MPSAHNLILMPDLLANSWSQNFTAFKPLSYSRRLPSYTLWFKISWNCGMSNNFGDDQSDSIETSGFSDDDENEDQDGESAPMAPVPGWDVFEVS